MSRARWGALQELLQACVLGAAVGAVWALVYVSVKGW